MSGIAQENPQMPKFSTVEHNGTLFMFNGTTGTHQLSNSPAFQFADDFDVDRIWVDEEGVFICEE